MKVYSAKNPTQAHILSGLMQSQGIDVEVKGDGLFGLKGEIPMTTETDPYLWLNNPAQYEQARQIIADYESEPVLEQSWQCSHCEEVIEGHFGACWQCGAMKP